MKDRVPAYPGRVTLTPVGGQANTYDMAMADEPTQAGDAPVKANLLTDATATALGLTSDATVNDALAATSFASQYVWEKVKPPCRNVIKKAAAASTVVVSGASGYSLTIYYTDTVTVGIAGDAHWGAITSVELSNNSATPANILKGKYWSRDSSFSFGYGTDSEIYFTPANAANASRTTSGSSATVSITAQKCSVGSEVQTGSREILFSPNANTYPSGKAGDYYYNSFGRFSNLPTSMYATGTYTGTGTNVEVTLAIGFTAKIIILFCPTVFPGFGLMLQGHRHGFSLRSGSSVTEINSFSITQWENGIVKFKGNEYINKSGNIYRYLAW